MFDFLSMINNYETRKVDRYDGDGFFVSTCRVPDSDQPYETGICHPRYNDDKVITVEMYETKKAAQIGHDKWVTKMTADKLPQIIEAC